MSYPEKKFMDDDLTTGGETSAPASYPPPPAYNNPGYVGGNPQAGYPQAGYPQGGYPMQAFQMQPQMQSQMQAANNTTIVTGQPAGGVNTVIVQQPAIIRPSSYLGLAIFVTLCFNPIFGIIGIVFSVMSSSAADEGNNDTARTYGKISLGISITNIFLTIGLVIFLVVYFVVIVRSVTCRYTYSSWYGSYRYSCK